MIHILGGMVLFMTDGIVVSEECAYVIKFRIWAQELTGGGGAPQDLLCIMHRRKVRVERVNE